MYKKDEIRVFKFKIFAQFYFMISYLVIVEVNIKIKIDKTKC